MSKYNYKKHRNFLITDYDTHDVNLRYKLHVHNGTLKYAKGQIETCPTTDKLHAQIFVTYKNATTISAVAKKLQASAIPVTELKQEAIDYGYKDETCYDVNTRFEYGTPPAIDKTKKPTRPKKLDAIKDDIDNGHTLEQLYDNHFSTMMQYRKGIHDYIQFKQSKHRNNKTQIIWIYGPTGTGKSRLAYEYDTTAYYKDLSESKWWNAYTQQDTVILDDLRKDTFKFHELLRLFDRYPLKLQTKGGITEFNSHTIIITTNKHWRDMYANRDNEDIEQLGRRIEHTIHLTTYHESNTLEKLINKDITYNTNIASYNIDNNENTIIPEVKTTIYLLPNELLHEIQSYIPTHHVTIELTDDQEDELIRTNYETYKQYKEGKCAFTITHKFNTLITLMDKYDSKIAERLKSERNILTTSLH